MAPSFGSDPRVDTLAIQNKFGLLSEGEEVWNVTPVWSRAAKSKRLVAPGDAGDAERFISGVIRLFEARTSTEHREAVELFTHDLLWDGPPITLSNKGHLRLATYLFKYFAHLQLHPTAVLLSQPAPGLNLIELDVVAVSKPHRVWWLPLTLLLPPAVSKNIHLKIGVNGSLESGKVELLTGRLTNLPPFLPAPLRAVNGMLMGALPHTFETPLGFAFDFADGGDFYARKRHALFSARHPGSPTPTLDWALDVATDLPGWLWEQGSVAAESVTAIAGRSFEGVGGAVSRLLNFYVWVFTQLWAIANNLLAHMSGSLNSAVDQAGSAANRLGTAAAHTFQPGTAQAGGGGIDGSGGTATATTLKPAPYSTGAALPLSKAQQAGTARVAAVRPIAASGGAL